MKTNEESGGSGALPPEAFFASGGKYGAREKPCRAKAFLSVTADRYKGAGGYCKVVKAEGFDIAP